MNAYRCANTTCWNKSIHHTATPPQCAACYMMMTPADGSVQQQHGAAIMQIATSLSMINSQLVILTDAIREKEMTY